MKKSKFSTCPTKWRRHRTCYPASSHGSYIWRSHGSYIWRSLNIALVPRTAKATTRAVVLRVTDRTHEMSHTWMSRVVALDPRTAEAIKSHPSNGTHINESHTWQFTLVTTDTHIKCHTYIKIYTYTTPHIWDVTHMKKSKWSTWSTNRRSHCTCCPASSHGSYTPTLWGPSVSLTSARKHPN